MRNKTILEQMGVEQWRLKEPLLKTIDDKALSNTEALSDTKALSNTKALSSSIETVNEIEKVDQTLEQTNPESTTAQSSSVVGEGIIETTKNEQQAPQQHDWSSLISMLNDDQNCASCLQGTSILGDGNPNADWMFVFDSPTARDIEQQKLLTGRVGQLFDAILLALELGRDDVYLSSIFKCPPAENIAQNLAQCDGLLEHQIKLVQPRAVITFGEFTAQALVKANESLDQLRAQQLSCVNQTVAVIPTYSLMQMLDTPSLKAKVWQDLKRARQLVKS